MRYLSLLFLVLLLSCKSFDSSRKEPDMAKIWALTELVQHRTSYIPNIFKEAYIIQVNGENNLSLYYNFSNKEIQRIQKSWSKIYKNIKIDEILLLNSISFSKMKATYTVTNNVKYIEVKGENCEKLTRKLNTLLQNSEKGKGLINMLFKTPPLLAPLDFPAINKDDLFLSLGDQVRGKFTTIKVNFVDEYKVIKKTKF